MKQRLYRFFKTFIGFIIAANGSILFGSGIVYIYRFIALCIEKGKGIFTSGYYSPIGYISFDFGYLIGLIFIIAGIYMIYLGARMAEILSK